MKNTSEEINYGHVFVHHTDDGICLLVLQNRTTPACQQRSMVYRWGFRLPASRLGLDAYGLKTLSFLSAGYRQQILDDCWPHWPHLVGGLNYRRSFGLPIRSFENHGS